MLIDVDDLPREAVIETDCCIVGAGAAGITLGLALDRAGIDTCILESGGQGFDAETQALGQAAPTTAAQDRNAFAQCTLRFLGGATNHWGGWCAPLSPTDLETRPWVSYSGWPLGWKDLAAWYPEAHRLCQLGPYEFDPSTTPGRHTPRWSPPRLETRYWQFSPPTRFGEVYRDTLKSSQQIRLYLHANCIGLQPDVTGRQIQSARVSTLAGNSATVKARRFVIACGGLENARLLLASNAVQARGIGNDHDLVGRFFTQNPEFDSATLQAHDGPSLTKAFELFSKTQVRVRAGVFLTAETQRNSKTLAWAATLHTTAQPDPDHYAPLMGDPDSGLPAQSLLTDAVGNVSAEIDRTAPHSERRLLRVRSRCEQSPNPESRVTLSDARDRLGVPRVNVQWRLNPDDLRSVRVANRLLAEEIGRLGLGRLNLDPWLRESMLEWPDNLWGGCHHMGTTRMASSPSQGVVNANCQVHGISNLYIAGSSVFPTGGCTNPTLTIVALALRLANHLAIENRSTTD